MRLLRATAQLRAQAQGRHPGLAAADVPEPGREQAARRRHQPGLPNSFEVALLQLARRRACPPLTLSEDADLSCYVRIASSQAVAFDIRGLQP